MHFPNANRKNNSYSHLVKGNGTVVLSGVTYTVSKLSITLTKLNEPNKFKNIFTKYQIQFTAATFIIIILTS